MEQHFEALGQTVANHVALSPISFLDRAEALFRPREAVIYGDIRRTWSETASRIRAVASGLQRLGIGKGATVSVLAPNIPELFELHFAVPLSGAVLNVINFRLEAATIAYILDHADAQVVIVDSAFGPLLQEAFALMGREIPIIPIIPINDPAADGPPLKDTDYETLATGKADPPTSLTDEWQAITLNYTSGTSGKPKGVVYHHRGAYLMALGTVAAWQMPHHLTYLSVVPMFHCNGWGHPWVMALLGGTMVFTRMPVPELILDAIRDHGVTHFGAAPIILQMLADAGDAARPFDPPVQVMTAGAPPPPAVLQRAQALGMNVMQVYGLTETYGHITQCLWQDDWAALPPDEQATRQAQQGIAFPMVDAVAVLEDGAPVPQDGATQGEIAIRGNTVMKGYYKDTAATEAAFKDGWFWSGDAAVVHPDGYIQITDRLKDVIISGGENISSVEVEAVLYGHPAVQAAAVVAKSDEKWGEVPCAFVELREGAAAEPEDIIGFCRERLAGFKAPKAVVFGELPKTATGKIQKFLLRERANSGDD
ncbi:MAG: AMP-binding protein [Pseudomonadota bacterium]